MAQVSQFQQKATPPSVAPPVQKKKADALSDPLQLKENALGAPSAKMAQGKDEKKQAKEEEKKPQMKKDDEPGSAGSATVMGKMAQAKDEKKQAKDEKKQAKDEKKQAKDEKKQLKEEEKKPQMKEDEEPGSAGSATVMGKMAQAKDEKKQAKDEKKQAKDEKKQAKDEKKQAKDEKKQAKDEKKQAKEEEKKPQMKEDEEPGSAGSATVMGKMAQAKGGGGPGEPKGGGSPLPEPVREKMEGSFGTDFSGVRVHEDSGASDMGALAYASGNDVTFAPGQYNPESQQGQELLGHELSHVVQQREGRVPAPPQGKSGPNQVPSLENEADVQGAKAARGEAVTPQAQTAQAKDDKKQAKDDKKQAKDEKKQAKDEKKQARPINLDKAIADGDASAEGGKIQLKESAIQADPAAGGAKTDFGGAAPQLTFSLGGHEYQLSWDNGPKAEIDLGGIEFPEGGWKENNQFPVNLVPGAGVIFGVEVGGGVKLSGKVAFGIKKDGDKWTVSLEKIGAEASLSVYGEVGIGGFIGVKGANISASAYARATAEAKVAVNGSAGISYEKGKWGGALDLGFNVEAALKAEVGVKANWEFLFWDGELGRFRLGEWYLASAGMGGKIGKTWPGGKTTGGFNKPWVKWGKPPEAQEA